MLELTNVEKIATPEQKINCYVAGYLIVADSITAFSTKTGAAAGADDTTPILIYILSKSLPKQIHTTMKYYYYY